MQKKGGQTIMKIVKVSEPGTKGGVTCYVTYIEKSDGVEVLEELLNGHKINSELKYMGIKSIGQLLDEYDEIIARIVDRFPDFFDNEDCGAEEIRQIILGNLER